MRWLTIALVTFVSASSMAATGLTAEAEKGASTEPISAPAAATQTDEERGFRKAPPAHLEQVQGLWARTEKTSFFSSQRITKEIKGDVETLTTYDSDGNVLSAHTVKIKLALAGPIRVFVFSDLKYTEGPNKGEKANGTQAYIYKVAGDKFIEFWGILGDADSPVLTHRWKRQPSTAL
jgi:hypothetical protein